MPIEQLPQPANDVFNYTFNRNRITAAAPAEHPKNKQHQDDPFQMFKRDKPRDNPHFRIE